MPRRLLVLATMLTALACHAQQRPEFGRNTRGQAITSLGGPHTRAVVLFFVASDCPVSNRTFPEMKRLRQKFSSRGVRFWFVYPNQNERPIQVRLHQSAYDPDGQALLDEAGALVRLSRARITPQVSVLAPDGAIHWKPVYTGRIDNRSIQFGKERPQPTEHFAERALSSLLAGRAVAPAIGTGAGCAIVNPAVSREP